MTALLFFGLRVALAASYLTLAVANTSAASDLLLPYAGVVLVVAVLDFVDARRQP